MNATDRLASSASASPELQRYAQRVASGECSWRDVERCASPVPSEVEELENSPLVTWFRPEPMPVEQELTTNRNGAS